jgi:hypothetical protein
MLYQSKDLYGVVPFFNLMILRHLFTLLPRTVQTIPCSVISFVTSFYAFPTHPHVSGNRFYLYRGESSLGYILDRKEQRTSEI